jgi:hypothetical protein
VDCYLGLDQSYTAFGISVLFDADHDTSMTGFPSDLYGTGVDRLGRIRGWLTGRLDQLAAEHTVRHVCMEGYSYGSKLGREQAGELGVAVKQALRASLPRPIGYPTVVPPSLLKLYVAGRGNADKDQMLSGVLARWGLDFTAVYGRARAHNLADAYGLARLAQALDQGSLDPQLRRKLRVHTERPPRHG